MSKIVLDEVTSTTQVSKINENFTKLETALNDKVLYRDNPSGEPNTLVTDVDVNGMKLYNLPAPTLQSQAARLQDVTDAIASANTAVLTSFSPYGTVSATNVQGAIQEVVSDLAASSGSDLVGFLQSGVDAVARTLQDKCRDFVSIKDFNIVGDGVADDTLALQAALTACSNGRTLNLENLIFKCTSSIAIYGDVIANGAALMFYGTTIPYLVTQTTEASLSGFIIDGLNVTNTQGGLFVDTDFVQKDTCRYDLTIQNIKNGNSSQACSGALIYKASSASVNLKSDLDIKLKVISVTATANSIEGDSGGKASGILVSFNGNGTDCKVNIHDCQVYSVSSGAVTPEEDSDGIHLYQNDFTSIDALGKWTVENCYTEDTRKRGFKIQAPNAYLHNCTSIGATLAGFETYGVYTTFDSCRARVSRTAFSTSFTNTTIINCFGRGAATDQPVVAVYGNSNSTRISKSRFIAAGTRVSNYVGVIKFYPGGTGSLTILEDLSLDCGTNTGSAIHINGGPHYVTARGLNVTGVDYGIFCYQSSGFITVSDSSVTSVSGSVLMTNAASKPDVKVINCILTGGNVNAGDSPLHVLSSVISKFGGGTCIYSTAANNRIVDCVVNTDTATDGINVGNSLVSGNRINTAKIGINYGSTTTAEVYNNVTVGTTTPYYKVGYTAFVEHDNYSR